MHVFITHTLYASVHTPPQHTLLSPFITPYQTNNVEINERFEFHTSQKCFVLPVRYVYVIQKLMVQLPVLEMFTFKKQGVPPTYTRVMLLRYKCTCWQCVFYCRYVTDFRQPITEKGGHRRNWLDGKRCAEWPYKVPTQFTECARTCDSSTTSNTRETSAIRLYYYCLKTGHLDKQACSAE
jgi:hypothetical protein